MIHAEAYTDCRQFRVQFDATKWAEQASEKELLSLVECGFGGDYPADAVAQYMSTVDANVTKLFDFLEVVSRQPLTGDKNGFECNVNESDFIAWLQKNRPEIVLVD